MTHLEIKAFEKFLNGQLFSTKHLRGNFPLKNYLLGVKSGGFILKINQLGPFLYINKDVSENIIHQVLAESDDQGFSNITVLLIVSISIVFYVFLLSRTQSRIKKRIAKEIRLRDKINEISRITNNQVLEKSALEELINSQGFDFDYAAFSTIDWFKDQIIMTSTSTKCEIDPGSWKHLSVYDMLGKRKDIIKEVILAEDKSLFHVKRNQVFKISIDSFSEYKFSDIESKALLNQQIVNDERFKHRELDRVFFPIKYLEEKIDSRMKNEFAVGVIEAGYHFTKTKKTIDLRNLSSLALYLDNCAQPYRRNFFNDQRHKANETVEELDKVYAEMPFNFKGFLEASCHQLLTSINCKMALLSFLTFEKKRDERNLINDVREISLSNSKKQKLIHGIREFYSKYEDGSKEPSLKYRYVLKTVDEVEEIDFLEQKIQSLKSALLIPIKFGKDLVGLAIVYSELPSFNETKKSFAKLFFERFSNIIYKRKTALFAYKLAMPFDLSDETLSEPNFINIIQEYFLARNVSVWIKAKNDDRQGVFVHEYCSQGLIESAEDSRGKILSIKDLPFKTDLYEMEDEDFLIQINALNKNAHFKSCYYIPIRRSDSIYGFILIYSAVKKPNIDSSSGNFANLIGDKLALTIVNNLLNDQFYSTTLKLTQPIIEGMYLNSSLHNANTTFKGIMSKYERYKDKILYEDTRNKLYLAKEFMDDLKVPLDDISNDLSELEEYWRYADQFNPKIIEFEHVWTDTITILGSRLDRIELNVSPKSLEGIKVYADESRLRHVILNLMINAIHASGKNGKIELKVNQGDSFTRIEVLDNGPGLPDGVLKEDIFRPYVTFKKPKGTGLGLAISKYIIEKHQGKIEFERKKDKTLLRVSLPTPQNDITI